MVNDDISKEELLKYYRSLSGMTSRERTEEKKARYDEMLAEGATPTEAFTKLQGEEQEVRELFKEEKEQKSRLEKEGKTLWKGEKSREKPENIKDSEESTKTPKEEYLETREKIASGLRKAEAIARGVVGLGSRRPIKEALISGAAKIKLALKAKPKSQREIEQEQELKDAYKEARHKTRLRDAREPTYRSRGYSQREPSIRDVGKGDMGSQKYDISTSPDFFGLESGFQMGTTNPLGSPRKSQLRGIKPPLTSISSKHIRPPSVSIPYGSNPPSTSLITKKETMKKMKVKNPIKEQDMVDFLGLRGYW